MNIVKRMSLGMIMQAVILLLHVFIHMLQFNDSDFEEHIQMLCSFIAVIFITYLTTFFLKLPIYTVITAQLITMLFVFIFEEEGCYLLYYLHKGHSQWFNSDILTDAIIIVLEMLVIQLPSAAFAKLSVHILKKSHK